MIDSCKFLNKPLVCKPIDTYKELSDFKENPPSWRSLCTDIKPHSNKVLKNCDLANFTECEPGKTWTFCHLDTEIIHYHPKHHAKLSLPKTLVCHEVNGYNDDSFIDGTDAWDIYTFYNWASIDIFCYYSHHLITIPPLSWINVGHDHGVKIIGTIITEWAEGTAFWEEVLSAENKMQNCVDNLVFIAKTLKLDGWLLNVENKVSKPQKLLDFVQGLCTTLHKELTDSVLIWADSVTIDGQLNWQNKLDSKNIDFFDMCDGFFTNYSWTPEDLKESVLAAGARLTDLYVGIDVWGHNFFGGGHFNTQEAVKIVASLGCSLAIYGPAWTHEAMISTSDKKEAMTSTSYNQEAMTSTRNEQEANFVENTDKLNNYQKFLLRDRALWDSMWPFLYTKLPSTLPFKTSFCRGQGKKRRFYGDVICPGPWYNLRHMNYQPNAAHGPHGYRFVNVEINTTASRRGTKGIIKLPDPEATTSALTIMEPTASLNKENNSMDEEELEEEEKQKKKDITGRIKDFFLRSTSTDEVNKGVETELKDIPGHSVRSSGISMMTMTADVNIKLAPCTDIRTRVALSHVPEELPCLEFFQEDSFMGGSCLKINPSDSSSDKHRTIILFHCDFICEATLIVCVVTKTLAEHKNQFLNVHLYAKDKAKKKYRVILAGRHVPYLKNSESSASFTTVYECNLSRTEFSDMQRYIMLNHPEFFVPVDNSFNWKVRYFQVNLPNINITSVNLRTENPQGAILLGHIGLCQRLPE